MGSSTRFIENYAAFGALLMYLFDFLCFSRFDQVLGHYLLCFGSSLMFFYDFSIAQNRDSDIQSVIVHVQVTLCG